MQRWLAPFFVLLAMLGCSTDNTNVNDSNDGGGALDGGSEASSDASGGDVVTTSLGPVQGTLTNGVRSFKNIPYAAPPLGSLRWRPPQPAVPWTTPRDGSAFGPTCVQLNYDGSAANSGSENCLTLNVWTPKVVTSPLPVLVFIHGGYFVGGSASDTWHGQMVYDGTALAATGPAVVVTLQYRLGALGFLADSNLASAGDAIGNFGLLDQIAALEWVKTNAAAFGGDPTHVTIFGQSAGGVSVCALLASPRAKGAFAGAMIESGACSAEDATTAAQQATDYEQAVGCATATDVASCLRAVPAFTAASTLPTTGRGPLKWYVSVDGNVLPDVPINLIGASTVPVIVGNTSDEMASQIQYYHLTYNPPVGQTQYEADLQQLYPSTWSKVEAEYPLSAFKSAIDAVVTATSDDLYICPGRTIARTLAARSVPAWRYVFEHAFEASDFPTGDTDPLTQYGAYHFIDVPYFFHDVSPTDFTFASDEIALSSQMIGYLLSFAKNGAPGSLPMTWPQYVDIPAGTDGGANDEIHVDFDTPLATRAGFRDDVCDFWVDGG